MDKQTAGTPQKQQKNESVVIDIDTEEDPELADFPSDSDSDPNFSSSGSSLPLLLLSH